LFDFANLVLHVDSEIFFCRNQTSSGKTYTMSGFGADPGVIPLAVCDLFDTARQVIN
jgi:centromeric protein E